MRQALLAAAVALSLSGIAVSNAEDYVYIGQTVSPNRHDVVGCNTQSSLLAWKQVVPPDIVLTSGWQQRLVQMGCALNEPGQTWRVLSIDGPLIHAQFYYQDEFLPLVFWFDATDLAPQQ